MEILSSRWNVSPDGSLLRLERMSLWRLWTAMNTSTHSLSAAERVESAEESERERERE